LARRTDGAVEELLVDVERDALLAPVALEGVQNVWYDPLPKAISAQGAILNIVKTVPFKRTPSSRRLQPTTRDNAVKAPRLKRLR